MKKLFIVMIIIIYGCDPFDTRVKIINNTNAPIIVKFDKDTIALTDKNLLEFYLKNILLPGDTKQYIKQGKEGWPVLVKSSSNKKLNIFIYHADSIKKFNKWDSLIINTKYIRKLSYSEDELNKMNWLITIK